MAKRFSMLFCCDDDGSITRAKRGSDKPAEAVDQRLTFGVELDEVHGGFVVAPVGRRCERFGMRDERVGSIAISVLKEI